MEYNKFTTTWRNWTGGQQSGVDKWHEPKSPAEVREILEGLTGSTRVRAIGSGHATSAVARPDDVVIDLRQMKDTLPTSSFHRAPRGLEGDQRLFRFEAGLTISELNDRLLAAGLGLANMGSFDGQKFIGAACTGTHGSGLKWGPLADSVVSIEMFTVEQNSSGRRVVRWKRIEPHDGITNPERFGSDPSEAGMDLVIDSDLFHASVVSMGCFGVVSAVTLKVVQAYWLMEVQQEGLWSKLRHKLLDKAREIGHTDVWIIPNRLPGGDDNVCQVVRRTKCDREHGGCFGTPQDRPVDCGLEFVAWAANQFGSAAIGQLANTSPMMFAKMIRDKFAKDAGQPFKSLSHKVYVLGIGDKVKAESNEIHVPFERAVEAIDIVLKLARDNEKEDLFHTSPIGVRFIHASDHWLSMSYGRQTCSIEVPLIIGTKGAETILKRIENALFALDGRPHWGQIHHLTRQKAEALYPRFNQWINFYRRFNKFGTFENKFTKQLDLPSEVTR